MASYSLSRPSSLSGLLLLAGLLLVGCDRPHHLDSVPPATPIVQANSAIEAGRYLVTVGGCNDCHTPGYPESGGATPEADWLVGSPVGFRGPWGTTYPSNLRLTVQDLSEDDWVQMLRTRTAQAPMPWMNVNKLSEQDARSVYRFIASLGSKGERTPVAVGPGQEPVTPYIVFEPLHMERLAQTTSPAAAPLSAPSPASDPALTPAAKARG